MRKLFAIIGILFSCAVIYVGIQYLNGDTQFVGSRTISAPDTASVAPSYADSGYASFGGDFYTYVNNNAAEASKAVRTVASNQIQIFEQIAQFKNILSRFFGFFLISIGGIGFCLFGCLCFTAKPIAPEAPVSYYVPQPNNANTDKEAGDRDKPYICEACGNVFTGWYQECPNCHTVGKMKKRI